MSRLKAGRIGRKDCRVALRPTRHDGWAPLYRLFVPTFAHMIRLLPLLLVLLSPLPASAAPPLPDFASYPVYHGPDLGLTWRGTQATLRVWAPTAEALHLKLYAAGTGGAVEADFAMTKAQEGTWTHALRHRRPAHTAGGALPLSANSR